jgi:NADH:ubiquinone reductase (H+-translocating)
MGNLPRRLRIIIVGSGFAGLNVTKGLVNVDAHITLIDKNNYHLFQPLLYQVAMAGLSPADIAYPIRSIFARQKNVHVIQGQVMSIDLNRKNVRGDFGQIGYDYLVIATGSNHSYFGHKDWEDHAPGLKTIEQATEIRRRVLSAYEKAEQETNTTKQKSLLTFVVVGAGPTGVEIAGALSEISRFTLKRDFRNIDSTTSQIFLIEAGPRVLPGYKEVSSLKAKKDLNKLGVQVLTDSRVSSINSEGIFIGDHFLSCQTVIWAAGVKPSSLNRFLGVTDPQGRLYVERDLSLKNHPEVFAAGDQVHFEQKGQILPGQAPVAMQQGLHIANNLIRILDKKKTKEFVYLDRGQMATIGRRRAIVNIGRYSLHGFLAWVFWLVVHIYYLIGFKNRFFVMFQWLWSYITYRKGARLILRKDWKQDRE